MGCVSSLEAKCNLQAPVPGPCSRSRGLASLTRTGHGAGCDLQCCWDPRNRKVFLSLSFQNLKQPSQKGIFPTGILVFSIFPVWVYNLLINSYFLIFSAVIFYHISNPSKCQQVICCHSARALWVRSWHVGIIWYWNDIGPSSQWRMQ